MADISQTQMGEATQNIAVLKKEIITLSKKIMEKYTQLINELGGSTEDGTTINKQPSFLEQDPFRAYVRLTSHYLGFVAGEGSIYVPSISTTGTHVTGVYAKKYLEQLRSAVELIEKCGDVETVLKKFEILEELERKEEERKMKALAEEWLKLPREEVVWSKRGVEIVKVRSKTAEYDPRRTSRIMGSVHYEVRSEGRSQPFYPDDFITSSGAVQKKKFKEFWTYRFQENTDEVAEILKELKESVENEHTKYHLW